MAGQAVSIADAVVTAINAKGDYSNSFTPGAVRKFLVNAKINREDISGVLCYVTPGTMQAQAVSENRFDESYTARVFVIGKVGKADDSDNLNETEISNLLTLVEEIQTQVIQYADANPATLRTAGVFTNDPIMDEERIETGVFLSVTEFTFKNYRSV